MATTTPKLGLPRPVASDAVTLVNQQALIDAIESGVSTFVQTATKNIGASNADVVKNKAAWLDKDTRTTVMTYTSGKLTKIEEKDGTTVIKTTSMTYDGSDRLSTVAEVAGGETVTSTISYDGSGNISTITKAVS
ncbi:hypothetical protein LOZ80_14875 [Paenibacillus sp. HWE-109]|uniref:hypothetical protein n=1 Tax=Paenibacillus sp. HWE-109 TaxID=1306526 RepID=UPI001EDFD784|nr:hypothetical protein [Paenibacillus sp. HWE-109]UKS30144.1 hypothetical protein LOZ80_14875 [Paenibacillus sp. HWE-109]